MKIIVGLGNPGEQYEKTRHNMGFMVLDQIQQDFDFEDFKSEKKFESEICSGNIGKEKIILAKPHTFMNKSGNAIQKIMQFFKISPDECLVICDDLDTQYGKLRFKKKGGPGTHNGLRSIVQQIGENFPRLRVGIESRGETSHEQIDTTSFVLNTFNQEETKDLPGIITKSAEAIKEFLSNDIDSAMNKFNS